MCKVSRALTKGYVQSNKLLCCFIQLVLYFNKHQFEELLS